MFRRKLLALDYSSPDSFNVSDEKKCRNIIIWLEDQKIRHYKIEDRVGLRNVDSADWKKHFEAYLGQLQCPYKSEDMTAVIDWLLGYAVRLEYGDGVDKYKGASPASAQSCTGKPAQVSSNPLDNLDFDDPDFKAGVASLAQMLQVPPHSDHTEVLKAVCLLVKEKLSKEAIEKAQSETGKAEHIPLEKTDLGFEAGDYIINDAAKIVRLLHIKDLRDLQTDINAAIVAVQALTANPKTDSRLGKVGR
ncbi:RNA transcription, translation and transport factor protein-like [Liolophura sinensis]|uniref:RNA transcription, translation and transport factor protein-like n=1 Tax=Liolophura sinensis TaxID=3198878 RepID=UPI0031585AF0